MEQKTSPQSHSKRLLLLGLMFVITLFCVSIASAEVAVITQQNDTSVEYKIDNGWFEWLPDWLGGETVAIFTKDYSDSSLTKAKAGGHGEFFTEHQLVDDINFYDRQDENINTLMKDVKLSYAQAENVTYEIPTYEEVCETVEGNTTNGTTYENCYSNLTGYTDEVREEWNWKEYNGEDIIGQFKWELTATKPNGMDVDWILTVFGQELLRWDWWDSNWQYKRAITNLNGSISALYYFNSTILSGENLSTVRFIDYDTETIELDYDIAFQNATHIGVRLNNYGSDKAYIYYGNDASTDASNASAVYLNPVDGYYFDENANDFVGSNDGTVIGATLAVDGYIGGAYKNNADGDGISINNIGATMIDNGEFSVSMWVNVTTSGGYAMCWELESGSGNENYGISMLCDSGDSYEPTIATGTGAGTTRRIDSGESILNAGWKHLVFTYDGTTGKLYINNVEKGSSTFSYNVNGDQNFIMREHSGASMIGLYDEFYFYDRALNTTEIAYLYNQTQPDFTLGAEQLQGATVKLITPEDALFTNVSNINFQCNATFDSNIDNLTLVIDGADNYTNTTTGLDISINQTVSLADGNHNWTCRAETVSEQITFGTNRTLSIDTVDPALSITSPLTSYDLLVNNQTLNLNWTVNDTNLDSCWYIYNSTEYNLTCGDNTTAFQYEANKNNLTFYANDTYGNLISTVHSWIPKVTEVAQLYENTTLAATDSAFSANISIASGYSITAAEFVYNGTSYAPTVILTSPGNYRLSYTNQAPLVSADTNYTFYWNVTLSSLDEIKLTEYNQSVLEFAIDDCSAYSNVLFNFTLLDETEQTFLDGTGQNTSIKVDLQLSTAVGVDLPINLSQDFNKVNPAAICSNVELDGGSYLLDALIEYSSADRFVEFYNIEQFELNEDTDNQSINLYNLLEEGGQEFKITYKGEDFVPVSNVLIQIQRKYVDEGVYKTIEIPMSGSNGYTIAHLVPNDVIYNLILLKDGEVIDTFVDVVASCQNPSFTECEINLNALISGQDLVALVTEDDIFSSLTYDYDTRTISTTYGILSGASANTELEVTLADNLGTTTVCSDSLIAAGGTLNCVIPGTFGNSTIHAQFIVNDDVRREGYVSLNQKPKEMFNGSIMFMAIIMVLFLVGIGVQENPGMMAITLILGTIILGAMNIMYTTSWIGAGATIMWFIIGLVTILIKGGTKR